jgi:2-phospho-L-lactate/phosphoenolpyruvate guanylyltransferase
MRAALLIPVKDLRNAKQRLGEALDQAHRSQLAEAMLRDVMIAAAGAGNRLDIFLVTGDPQAQAMADEFKFGVIEDRRNESETAAIEMATAWCVRQRYDTTVVMPCDIPLATSAELHNVNYPIAFW